MIRFFTPRRAVQASAMALTWMAAPALAAPGHWQISGSVGGLCKIEFECPGSKTCTQIRFSNKPNETSGTVKWRCNVTGQPVTLTFRSENGGVLINPQDTESLPYSMSYSGAGTSGVSARSLTSPVQVPGVSGQAFAEMTGVISLDITPRRSKLIAGRYNDQISVTITPSGL